MTTTKEIKPGNKVYYLNDPMREEYTVYAIYSDTKLSLGLRDYPDTEQDFMVNINEIDVYPSDFVDF